MTEREYRRMITRSQEAIERLERDIRENEVKIDELKQMITQIKKVRSAIEDASRNARSKLSALAVSVFHAGQKLAGRFFSSNENAYSGLEYQKSCAAADSSIDKAKSKIDELVDKIDDDRLEIQRQRRLICEYKADIAALEEEGATV